MKKLLICVALIATTIGSALAQVKFASPYTDNMVIKQSSEVTIWGSAPALQMITITNSWAPADTIKVKATEYGTWRTTIKTPAADNVAHTITANGTTLENVMLGEVWLCSGQSNMHWCVDFKFFDSEKHAKEANHPNIRIFQTTRQGSFTPQESTDAVWTTCTPATMRITSAIGYFFARELHQELDIPIGIIVSAWGGTPVEAWMPAEAFDEDMMANAMIKEGGARPGLPSILYNKMIHPLVPFNLSGMLWYQGENNVEKAPHYHKLLNAMVTSWRERFEDENLPFYCVQIAPYNYKTKNTLAAELREAQEKITLMNNTGIVIVSDLVDNVNNIHPKDKLNVGIRLSKFALSEVYGADIKEYKSPTFSKATFTNKKAVVELKDLYSDLSCRGDKIEGFTIATDSGEFVEAEAKIVKNKIEVWSDKVKNPTRVRYCFDNTTFGNLFNEAGLPVAPFRSDRDF